MRGNPADALVGAIVGVSPQPFCGEVLSLLDGFDDVLIQPLVPDRAVVALDVGVLLRLAGLDVPDGDPMLFGPLQQRAADVFGAIVDLSRFHAAPRLVLGCLAFESYRAFPSQC